MVAGYLAAQCEPSQPVSADHRSTLQRQTSNETAEPEQSAAAGASARLRSRDELFPKQITVQEVRFSGLNHLSPQEQEAIAAQFQGKTFPSTDREEAQGSWVSDWLEELTSRVRDPLMQQGYFLAQVSPKITELRSEGNRREVAVEIQVREGEQYRLKGVRFKNNQAFPAEQLRAVIPLRDGEVLNAEKVREGLEALRKLYGSKGYINFTVVPDTEVDQAGRAILIALDFDEGGVFKVGKLEVLGLDSEATRKLLAMLKPGEVYDSSTWDRFSRQFPGLLPKGASFDQATEISQSNITCTVDILLDFRQR